MATKNHHCISSLDKTGTFYSNLAFILRVSLKWTITSHNSKSNTLSPLMKDSRIPCLPDDFINTVLYNSVYNFFEDDNSYTVV